LTAVATPQTMIRNFLIMTYIDRWMGRMGRTYEVNEAPLSSSKTIHACFRLALFLSQAILPVPISPPLSHFSPPLLFTLIATHLLAVPAFRETL
jgi:hypothetical protein